MYVLSNNLTMKIGTKREGGCTCRNFSDFSSTSTEYIDFHFCVIVPSLAPYLLYYFPSSNNTILLLNTYNINN